MIHKIRSKHDFQKHYLTPLRTSPKPNASLVRAQARRRREVQWGRTQRQERERQQRAADELERAIEKRRWVYRHHLYAKVCAPSTLQLRGRDSCEGSMLPRTHTPDTSLFLRHPSSRETKTS